MTATDTTRSGGRRNLALGLLVIGVVVVLALLATGGKTRRSGPQLSPHSDDPDGTSALVGLLSALGATPTVVASAPPSSAQTALLLSDNLSTQQRADLDHWVTNGGALVIADPGSKLAPRVSGDLNAGAAIARGACDLGGVDAVSTIRTALAVKGLALPQPVRYRAIEGGASCFDRYVVREAHGAGSITAVGGAEPFVNALLASGDGSTLAVDLLAPTDRERVAIIDVVPAAGAGAEPLLDLIAPRVTQAIGIGVVAFVLFALYRGRRLGKPVVESQPVALAGSGLVTAVGHLQQRAGSTDRAASALRADTRRAIIRRFGLPAGAPPATIADVVAARTGLDRERVAGAVGDAPVLDERALVQLSAELDTIRQEVLHVRR